MAGGLLLWGLLMAPGCVIPSWNDTVLQDPPVLLNRPPRILEKAISPGNRCLCVKQGSMDCSKPQPGICVYSLGSVTDPDLCDDLQLQWFVDYNINTHAALIQPNVIDVFHAQGNTDPIRTLPTDPLPAGDALDLTSKAASLSVGVHIIEAMVSDGTIQPTDQGRSSKPRDTFQNCFDPKVVQFPDGGPAKDQTYSVIYAWTLVVSTDCGTFGCQQ
jgi:hypothetical protein